MDRSTPIYLVAQTYTADNAAIITAETVERMVFANITSVSLSEWTEGARIGLNPELRFTMFAPDYQGEEILKYDGMYYSIYRTYHGRNDTIDLYCERKNGTDNPAGAADNGDQ